MFPFPLAINGYITPSLDLEFLSGTLDSRITFTRSGTNATSYNSSGTLITNGANVARFDYNPATLAKRGLLIEQASTNICLQSEDFTTTWTTVTATVTANNTTAPDGNNTADRLNEAAGTTTHRVTQGSIAVTNTTVYAMSCFVKAGTLGYALMITGGGLPTAGISINLTTGAVSTATGSPLTSFTQTLPNGWFRVGFTIAATSTANANMDIYCSTDGVYANRTYAGNTANNLYLWGAQLEAAGSITSYIATTTTSQTRNIDTADITTLSPWYSSSTGTIMAWAERDQTPPSGTNPCMASINDASTANRMYLNINTSPQNTFNVVASSSTQATINVNGNATGFNKIAAGYATNSFNSAVNGTLGTLDTAGTVPTVTQLSIGKDRASINPYNGWIRAIRYYPFRTNDTTLKTLTS